MHVADEWVDINDLTTITIIHALTAKEFIESEDA
jgi:hypothetical protein